MFEADTVLLYKKKLAKNGRLEIGLQFARSAESKFGFLSLGCTDACFRHSGTTPNSRHLFIKRRSIGPISLNTCLNKHAGIVSSGEPVGFSCFTMSFKNVIEIGVNLLNKPL